MKSRALGIATAIALTVTVAACSSPTASPTPAPSEPPPTPSVAPTAKVYQYSDMVVGFIQTSSESGWRAANTNSFRETANARGITLKFTDSQNKIENQIAAFNEYIQDKDVNVIVLAAVARTGYDDVLKAAKQAGKIVVIEDRRIEASSDLYLTYVGSDFDKEGRDAAAAMCDLLKDKPKRNVVEIHGDEAAPAAIDRAKGFREAMTKCNITITASQAAPAWDPVQGKAIMQAFLMASRDVQGVYGHNDDLAIAAIGAIKEAGLVPGKDVMVVGVNATADGFKHLITGELGADIECNPLLAPQVYEAALKGLNGDTSLPKWIPAQEGAFFAVQGAAALQEILKTRKY